MKYIFDFDDVLFYTTKKFKERIFLCLEEVGVSRDVSQKFYMEIPKVEFSLKNYISNLLSFENKDKSKIEEIYKKIMSECTNFSNTKLLEKIRSYGKDNCIILSNGDKEFQMDKIESCGIAPLFKNIIIVPGSKKDVVYKICEEYRDEKVIFYDDKIKFFDDIDKTKCPNLETILYTGQDIEPYLQ